MSNNCEIEYIVTFNVPSKVKTAVYVYIDGLIDRLIHEELLTQDNVDIEVSESDCEDEIEYIVTLKVPLKAERDTYEYIDELIFRLTHEGLLTQDDVAIVINRI